MPTARAGFAAATGPDGRIYAIGGGGDTGSGNTVEAYAPGTNSWATLASMPTARSLLAAATGPDGRIYAIGGNHGSGVVNTVEAYDTKSAP
jgi:N-acetylneuraminic acid mutarotase